MSKKVILGITITAVLLGGLVVTKKLIKRLRKNRNEKSEEE